MFNIVLLFILKASLLNLALACCTANVAAPTGWTNVVILRDSQEKLCERSQLNNNSSRLDACFVLLLFEEAYAAAVA